MSQKSQGENTREAMEFVNYVTPGLTITTLRLNMGIFRLNEARYFTLFLIMQFPDTFEKRCCKWYAFVRKTINYSWEEITSFSFWSVLASTANFLTRILPILSPEWIFLNAHVLRMLFRPVGLLLWQSLYHSEICNSKRRRGLIWPLCLHLTMLNLRWSFTLLMLDQLLILCILRYSKLNKNSCSLFQETGRQFRRRGIQYSFSIIKLYS